MTINEKECIIEVLSQVRNEVEQELTRQNLRGDNRHKNGKSTLQVDGHCDGLEKAVKIIEAKEEEIQGIRTQRPPQNVDEIVKFTEMMELLRAGKKVAVKDRRYGSSIPTIKVTGTNGNTDNIPLDCCCYNDFDSYMPEQNISSLDTVSVVSYESGKSSLIEYVYANHQMNRLFAHLENGKEVDYDFSVLDVWGAYGGEWKEPEMREVTLTFFKNYDDLHRKYYTTETQLVPADYRVDEVVDYINENVTSYKGMDIIISFKPEDEIGYPCFISWKERK